MNTFSLHHVPTEYCVLVNTFSLHHVPVLHVIQILELPSKLFYENELICKADLPKDGPVHICPLQFIGVDGKEKQSEDSPSFYNFLEAITIVEQVYKCILHLLFISLLM